MEGGVPGWIELNPETAPLQPYNGSYGGWPLLHACAPKAGERVA